MKKRQKLLAAGAAGVLVLGICVGRSPVFRRMLAPQAIAAYAPAQSFDGVLPPEDQSLWQKGTRLLARLTEEILDVGMIEDGFAGPGMKVLPEDTNISDVPAVGPGSHHHHLPEAPEQPAPPVLPQKPEPKDPAVGPKPEQKAVPPIAEKPQVLSGPMEEKNVPKAEKKLPEPEKERNTPEISEKEKVTKDSAATHCGPLKEDHGPLFHH